MSKWETKHQSKRQTRKYKEKQGKILEATDRHRSLTAVPPWPMTARGEETPEKNVGNETGFLERGGGRGPNLHHREGGVGCQFIDGGHSISNTNRERKSSTQDKKKKLKGRGRER